MPMNDGSRQPPGQELKRGSEDRRDELASFVAASGMGHWVADAKSLGWAYRNPAFSRIAGPFADLRAWLSSIAGDDGESVERIVSMLRRGEMQSIDYRTDPLGAPGSWRREFMFPIMSAGHVLLIGGHSIDIEQSAELEQYQRSLLHELKHRVRNVLANVRSIARRTGEASGNVADYMMHLDGRIAALARVQTVMVRDIHARMDLDSLLADTLAAAAAHEGEQISIRGPRVVLKDRQASTLGLAIHELTTNAIKFGALINGDGRLDIKWTLEDRDGRQFLALEWRESWQRSRPHQFSSHRGFGLDYLENSLVFELDARVRTSLHEGGFYCFIDLPLG